MILQYLTQSLQQFFPKVFALLGMGLLLASLTLSAAITTAISTIGSVPSGFPSSGSLVSASTDASLASDPAVDELLSSKTKHYIGYSLIEYQAHPDNVNYQIPPNVLMNRDGMLPDGGFGQGGRNVNANLGAEGLEIMFSTAGIWQAMSVRYIQILLLRIIPSHSQSEKQAGYSCLTNAGFYAQKHPWIPTRAQYAEYARVMWPSWLMNQKWGAHVYAFMTEPSLILVTSNNHYVTFPNELRADQLPSMPGQVGRPREGVLEQAFWPGAQNQYAFAGAGTRVFTFRMSISPFWNRWNI